MSTWYRECYQFPHWRMTVGWPDGYARGHWVDGPEGKAAVERTIAVTLEKGGNAFMETKVMRNGGQSKD